MASERNETTTSPYTKRMDEMEPEWRIIRARFRGEPYEHLEFDEAMFVVALAVNAAAHAIVSTNRKELWPLMKPLAANGQLRFWVFMLKPDGGFFKHDGTSPIGPYAFKTLKCICLGRENRQDVARWETPRCTPERIRQNRDRNPARKPNIDRRTVTLDFDPVDSYSSDDMVRRRNANEAAWSLLAELPPDQLEALVLRHIKGANLSAVERARGLLKGHLHRLADKAKRNLRRQYPNFEW